MSVNGGVWYSADAVRRLQAIGIGREMGVAGFEEYLEIKHSTSTRKCTMTVHGYIGLGMMGSAMCERLARSGAAVLAHDVNPLQSTPLSSSATAAGSTEEVAEQADIISTCVPAAHLDAVIDELATVGREPDPAHPLDGPP